MTNKIDNPIATGELAKRLNVSRDTIRNYARDFAEFLSSEATGVAPNARRRFNAADCLTVATIAELRGKGLTVDQVKEALRSGRRVDTVPDVPTPEAEAVQKSVGLIALPEYERVLTLLQSKEAELARIIQERNQALIAREDATRQIAELREEIGNLKGQLQAINKGDWWLKFLAIAALIVAAIVITIIALSAFLR